MDQQHLLGPRAWKHALGGLSMFCNSAVGDGVSGSISTSRRWAINTIRQWWTEGVFGHHVTASVQLLRPHPAVYSRIRVARTYRGSLATHMQAAWTSSTNSVVDESACTRHTRTCFTAIQ